MKRVIFLAAALSLAICHPSLHAEEAVAPGRPSLSGSLMNWFKNWKEGLEKSAVESRYRQVRTTSVAAVRGAKQESDAHQLYWKGSLADKKASQNMAERKELAVAVDLTLAGKYDEAQKKFDAFEAVHPKSVFLPDVKQARANLAKLRNGASAPEANKNP